MGTDELGDDLRSLIGHHMPTMDHVAVLLILHNAPGDAHSRHDVARLTRLDLTVTERVLRELAASRLAEREGEEFRYAPAAELRDSVDALAEMNRTRPVTLVRAIYDRPARAAQSFADAFRVRKATE